MTRSVVDGMRKVRICATPWSLTSTRRYSPRASKTLNPEPNPKEQGNAEEASLPLLQRCKNILLSNWRGQLSTVKEDERSVHGSISQYSVVAGQTLVWIPKNDPHESNFLMDNRGSLVIGHTDPTPLVHTMRSVGHVPPRTILLAEFDPVPDYEMEYVKKRVVKLMSSTKQAIENAGPATQSFLRDSGNSLNARLRALDAMAHSKEKDFSVYRLSLKTCHYVDLLGGRHPVEASDLMGAVTDHLCPLSSALIEGVNQSDNRRMALIMFCAVYVQERVQDAYIFSADRWGINILAKTAAKHSDEDKNSTTQSPEMERAKWREFRFSFSHEVKNTEHFCLMLAEMEKECVEALNKAQELLSEQ
ncbi:hypothetical protein MPTK1_1g28500 [Marchantia polymorpha subsp. ruderalis]|uniref:Uncharacterized protein n=2 Tax=Marchantia polymorpha TaxID=3197 RepID=A0AAF6AV86_MARPO|nr:hypothetical protein MARPO_0002s0030 [Marchantia polymorpha]BBN00357.1 hypothetical protein Mp_1g28500 [Marchantia polymorpha subsp. ruderalis]|eukprot:PTQ49525.1 hypothetical protein MARPO_0002s0030 [Marchantia polymorpha]